MEVLELQVLKNVDKTKLPIQYFRQAKAWMTGEILDSILKGLKEWWEIGFAYDG